MTQIVPKMNPMSMTMPNALLTPSIQGRGEDGREPKGGCQK